MPIFFSIALMSVMIILKMPFNLVFAQDRCGKEQIRNTAHSAIRETIKDRTKTSDNAIFRAVINESNRFCLNPLLLMAIIETESGFKTKKRGRHGEIGLMQIKPSTARWIAKKTKLPWHGKKQLEDPATNIKIGAAYLAFLRKEFSEHKYLYLSAYNMGSKNVRKSMKKRVTPKKYAARVLRHYRAFYSRVASRQA